MSNLLSRAVGGGVLITGAVAALLAAPAVAASPGVQADPAVSQVSYAEFQGLVAEEVRGSLDALDFWAVPRHAPAGYYDDVQLVTVEALRRSLHDLIDGHAVHPYSTSTVPGDAGHRVDAWDIVALADRHPEHRDRVLDLYLNGTFDRQDKGTNSNPRYDREHSWPKSLGFPANSTSNPVYSDCHHLFAAYNSYNSSRSNLPYGEGADGAAGLTKPTLENAGRGGALTDADGDNLNHGDVFETWIGRRGDVARAMFYMALRYEGDAEGEADLRLTDTASDVVARDAWSQRGDAFMGLRSVLLAWHAEDLVDDLERRRNTVIYLFQGNRNPFIDHPEWVGALFNGESLGSGDGTEPDQVPWINELHYDNAGRDAGEFVEIAGPAGIDLSGWSLMGYNGNGGRAYRTVLLSGVIPDQANGVGALAFDFPGLQNGDRGPQGVPDGLALVDPADRVVEFLSYEWRFSAVDGPAQDEPSADIGVHEPTDTPEGFSLQLGGRGVSAGDFRWTAPATNTRGAPNVDQRFEEAPSP